MEYFVFCVPVDWANTGHVFGGTHPLRKESIPDLPGKHGGVFVLVAGDGIHHFWCRHFRLGSADDARLNGARLIISEGGEQNI